MENVKIVARLEEQAIALNTEHKEVLNWQRSHYENQLAHRDLLI
jgi:hypothetical protein